MLTSPVETVKLRFAPVKFYLLFFIVLAIGSFPIWRGIRQMIADEISFVPIVYLFVPVLFIFFIISARRFFFLMANRTAIVTLSPQGLRDVRLFKDIIPWHAITGFSEKGFRPLKYVTITIDPDFMRDFALRTSPLFLYSIYKVFGSTRFEINTFEVDMNSAELLNLLREYREGSVFG